MVGVENVKSMAKMVLLEGFILACSLLLSITMLSCSSNFSIIFPLVSVLYEPHIWLWLLKSPTMMKGLGSCLMMFSKSKSVKLNWFKM